MHADEFMNVWFLKQTRQGVRRKPVLCECKTMHKRTKHMQHADVLRITASFKGKATQALQCRIVGSEYASIKPHATPTKVFPSLPNGVIQSVQLSLMQALYQGFSSTYLQSCISQLQKPCRSLQHALKQTTKLLQHPPHRSTRTYLCTLFLRKSYVTRVSNITTHYWSI